MIISFVVAGTAIVTEQSAAMWTDGRYFLQAAQQMDSNWTLMKMGEVDPDFLDLRLKLNSRQTTKYILRWHMWELL